MRRRRISIANSTDASAATPTRTNSVEPAAVNSGQLYARTIISIEMSKMLDAKHELVPTSSVKNGNSHDRAGQGSEQGSNQKDGRGWTDRDHVEALLKSGFVATPALVGPGVLRARSKDAQRMKAKRDQLKGTERQINVWAPDNPEAREFVIMAAKAVKSRRVLKALRSALDDPSLVRIGQKVLKLKGEAGAEVRRALGL